MSTNEILPKVCPTCGTCPTCNKKTYASPYVYPNNPYIGTPMPPYQVQTSPPGYPYTVTVNNC